MKLEKGWRAEIFYLSNREANMKNGTQSRLSFMSV